MFVLNANVPVCFGQVNLLRLTGLRWAGGFVAFVNADSSNELDKYAKRKNKQTMGGRCSTFGTRFFTFRRVWLSAHRSGTRGRDLVPEAECVSPMLSFKRL